MKKATDEVTEADISTLPRRFRLHIGRLQSRVEELEGAQLLEKESKVIVEPYGAARFLPDRTDMRFMTSSGGIDVNLRAARRGTGTVLRISSVNGLLLVYPEVSNVISIGVEP